MNAEPVPTRSVKHAMALLDPIAEALAHAHARGVCTPSVSLARGKAMKIIPVVEVSTFAGDEVLDVPGKPRAVHIPGHTPGNAVMFFESRRALLSGDTLVTRNPLTGRTGLQVMPSGFTQDTAQALASLSALADLNAEVVLPAHGDPWHGPVSQAVQLARAAGPS